MKFKLITAPIVLIYLIFMGISGAKFENSDISTVLIPIVFYTFVSILLRNCKLSKEETNRLNDLNDINLFSYALTFIGLKFGLYNVINKYIPSNSIIDKAIIVGGAIASIVILLTIICMFLLWLSKRSDDENHWHE